MGNGASIPGTKEEALAEGYTEEQIKAFEEQSKKNAEKLEMDMIMAETGDQQAHATMEKPKPQTYGFEFPNSMFDYKLEGKWDERMWQEYAEEAAQNTPEALDAWHNMTIAEQRPMVDQYAELFNSEPTNQAYLKKVTVTEMEIDSTSYGTCDNPAIKVYAFRPLGEQLGLDGKPRPAMVFCHGGPGLYHSAKLFDSLPARFAADYGIVVFSVDYRKAPEHKAPAQAFDAVGTILHMREHATSLVIDPNRIVLSGDTGGATVICGAALELTRRGIPDAVKLVLPVHPLVSDLYVRGGVELGGVEAIWGSSWHQIKRHLTPSKADKEAFEAFDDTYLYPNKMRDEIAAKFPMTVFITCEFDVSRRCAEELAMVLHKHGRLGDFVCHPGTTMVWHFAYKRALTGIFWADIRKIFEKFLFPTSEGDGASKSDGATESKSQANDTQTNSEAEAASAEKTTAQPNPETQAGPAETATSS